MTTVGAWLGCVVLAACAARAGAASAFVHRTRAPAVPRLRGGSEQPGLEDDEMPPPAGEDDDVEIEDFDIVVIGGGSGGLACAQEAAKHGKSVAVCDFVSPSPAGTTWGLGGTCVNVGCIPKKLMHHAALLGGALADASSYGWEVAAHPPRHSWETLVQNVQNHVKSLNFGYKAALLSADVEYVNGFAVFEHAHLVRTTDKDGAVRRLRAKAFVIAVGGRPRYLDHIPGGRDLVISSDDLFSLARPPGKTLLIGGGYVALECAGFIAGLGMEAHVLVRSVPLRGFDRQMAELVCAHMEGEQGVRLTRGAVPLRIERAGETQPAAGAPRGRLRVTWSVPAGAAGERREESDEYDTVIVAVGRNAQTAGLGLERAGVQVDAASGKVLGVRGEQTSVAHIHAIGDVLHGKPELTPVAIQAGRLLARRLCGVADARMDYEGVPTAVFTPLEYAAVGMSEEDALATHGQARARARRRPRALARGAPAAASRVRLPPRCCAPPAPAGRRASRCCTPFTSRSSGRCRTGPTMRATSRCSSNVRARCARSACMSAGRRLARWCRALPSPSRPAARARTSSRQSRSTRRAPKSSSRSPPPSAQAPIRASEAAEARRRRLALPPAGEGGDGGRPGSTAHSRSTRLRTAPSRPGRGRRALPPRDDDARLKVHSAPAAHPTTRP